MSWHELAVQGVAIRERVRRLREMSEAHPLRDFVELLRAHGPGFRVS